MTDRQIIILSDSYSLQAVERYKDAVLSGDLTSPTQPSPEVGDKFIPEQD
jgi:hypothetical protein